MKNMCSENYF